MIDSHQHFWKYDPVEYGWIDEKMTVLQHDFLPADLIPALKEHNIEGTIAVQARQTPEENEFLLSLAENNNFIKGVIGWMNLKDDDLAGKLEGFREDQKMKGFRHIIQGEKDEDFLLNDKFIKGIKILGQYKFTYDILIYENQLPAAIKFIDHFSDQTFILDHVGKPDIKKGLSQSWEKGIKSISSYPNLYCKLSGLVTEADWNNWTTATFKEYLDIIVESFGTHRIMYGSDWPVCLLATNRYENTLNIFTEYFSEYSDEEKSMIFGGNAKNCYQLI